MAIIGFIAGAVLGVGIAYYLTWKMIKSSNDLGDSRGTFRDFSDQPLNVIEKKDRVKKDFSPPEYS